MLICALDLGASFVRACLFDNGKMKARLKEETQKGSARELCRQLFSMVKSLCSSEGIKATDLAGVGIASVGPLDLRQGAILGSPNLDIPKVSLVPYLERNLGVKVLLLNDCVAAAIGEWKFGAGKGYSDLVYLTISTGIGAGVIVDGHVLFGKDGNAHEVGHLVIDIDGRLVCGDGKRGHWEAYCSGRNIPNYVRMRLPELEREFRRSMLWKLTQGRTDKITSEKLFYCARKGDRFSIQLVEEIGKINAMGVASVVNAYDPALLILGGSVVLQNRDLVVRPIRKNINKYLLNRRPKIIVTSLGEDVALYGAAAVVSNPELIRR